MKRFGIACTVLVLLLAAFKAPVLAKEPPGADLVSMDYSPERGLAVLSRYELFTSRDGRDWAPAGFTDRAAALTGVGVGKGLVLVGSESGTLYRSVDGGPFQEVPAPKDPYGRKVTGVRIIAVGPGDVEVMASSGQGVIRSADKGATWQPVADPFWSNPEAREVIAIGYAKGDPIVVTRRGAYRQTKAGFEPITRGLPDKVRPTVASVFEGEVLMGLPGEGIYTASKDSAFKKLKGAPGDPIAFVGFAGGGYLAARPTTELHLSDSKGTEWKPVGQYAPSFIPMDSATTPFGDFILLRGKGLVKLEGEMFAPVELPGNLSSVNAQLTARGNQVAGTQGGVFLSASAGKAWEDVTPPDLGSAVNVFLPLDDGRILLGSEGSGVFVSEDAGRTWRNWSLRLGTANTIKGLVGYAGGILAATENGLMWTALAAEPNWQSRDGGIGRTPAAALVREKDNYWLATQSGVYAARGDGDFAPVAGMKGRATAISVENGRLLALVDCKVLLSDKGAAPVELTWSPRCIATDVALVGGVPYAGTNMGVYRWDGATWVREGTAAHPVAHLVGGQDGVRVVTRGAGSWMLR